MIKVRLLLFVIPFDGKAFRAERIVEMPCVHVGMEIYGAQHVPLGCDEWCDTVKELFWEINYPDRITAFLGDFDGAGLAEDTDDLNDKKTYTREALLTNELRDWRVAD